MPFSLFYVEDFDLILSGTEGRTSGWEGDRGEEQIRLQYPSTRQSRVYRRLVVSHSMTPEIGLSTFDGTNLNLRLGKGHLGTPLTSGPTVNRRNSHWLGLLGPLNGGLRTGYLRHSVCYLRRQDSVMQNLIKECTVTVDYVVGLIWKVWVWTTGSVTSVSIH